MEGALGAEAGGRVMPMPLIIGFGHRARQGKNIAAEAIAEIAPRCVVMGFADALKRMCADYWRMTEKDPLLLQRVGQGIRDFDHDFWVKQLERAVPTECDTLLITDLRYQNEFDWIKRHVGGYCVKVTRLVDGEPFVSGDRDPNHSSEVALADAKWDAELIRENPINLKGDARLVYHRFLKMAQADWYLETMGEVDRMVN